MAFDTTGVTRYLARGAAVAVVAFGASACSSMPSMPSMPSWLGGDSAPASTADDQADQQAAANASTPDLNGVPEKPTPPSTSDEQKALSASLGADRARNQYSSDQLRGGTEAAAAPPGAPPPDQMANVSVPPAGTPPSDQTADASATPAQPTAAPPPGAPPSSADSGTIDAAAAANASTADQTPPAAVPPATTTTADNAAVPAVPPQQQVAMNTPPAVASSGSEPAVPAVEDAAPSYNELVNPSDAALGFKPSMAPPLSPSVAQFVPQPIIARYQQTAAMGRAPGVEGGYASNRAIGGPEHMSGAVVANFDALNAGSAIPGYSAYGAPSAVVMFAGDRTILDAAGKQQVRAAAAAFQQAGGQGFVHVVGHSASSGNLSSERHMVLNFEHSQARATAVARELIKDGVPADKVLVETSGGADSGSSAEIFLQS